MPHLVDAYLTYRAHDSGNGMPSYEVMSDTSIDTSGSILDVELVDLFSEYSTLSVAMANKQVRMRNTESCCAAPSSIPE